MKGGLLAALTLGAILLLAPAQATIGTIQPGDQSVSGGSGCTLNFVYDGVGDDAGRVFMGSAAHCVSALGDSVSSWPYADFGTVALIGSEATAPTDWALIEVKPELHRVVRAAVKGHPSYPTGLALAGETEIGDMVQLSGYGTGFGASAPTQERRVGVLGIHEAHQHQIVAPVVWGDSGGPIVHVPSGGALGLHSRLCLAWACTEYGPTIEGVIAQAAAKGVTVQLRTV